eukprot:CAMPEP_0194053596 /NCGR_PEP_ID=MMETSP0009_2-20130614/50530_1 /TAXON_ID=210454 /ORGANISM="Grammatophora oceanica, Strain CCMP 410" /LENGTH=88 /DNA_ID=CAMNT_0038701777 /DNA_START=25 /DNA_END=287 /DNA_ORIENTATION=-
MDIQMVKSLSSSLCGPLNGLLISRLSRIPQRALPARHVFALERLTKVIVPIYSQLANITHTPPTTAVQLVAPTVLQHSLPTGWIGAYS